MAIAVNEDGYREVLGAAEGMKEDKASWLSFFQWLKGRGLNGVSSSLVTNVWECWRRWVKSFPTPNTSAALSFFPECVQRRPQIQGETGSQNAQGDPRPGEQEGVEGEGAGSRCRTESNETAGGRQEG